MALRIEDYAMVGDCESAALIGRDGSVDWLCWPNFDAESCFTALLGTAEHGRWLLAPAPLDNESPRVSRRYMDHTMVLETRWETATGTVTVTDLMPTSLDTQALIRIVHGESGEVTMRTELVVRFGYGSSVPWATRLDDGALRLIAGPDMLVLRTPAELRGEDLRTVGEFTVRAGETVPFTLSYAESHLPLPPPIDHAAALAETLGFWREWAGRCQPAGQWTELVRRSLLTLKALTYAPTGGIVAAATTSLPEELGGERNWDYRVCWLRDATLTLLALMHAGYFEEATAWRDWLLRALAGNPGEGQIMYGLAGQRRLTEWEVDWLPGYEGSRPVRIGNAAHEQRQLDVPGEVMDALHQARVGGMPEDDHAWSLRSFILERLEQMWREPDQGIWEMRGAPQHFVHSKVMAWVAYDRAIRSAETFGLPGPVEHWKQVREAIHQDVCERGFDAKLNSFVQAYGSQALDASLLLIPAVGFLPPDDPRVAGTVAAVEKHLIVENGLVQRYRTTGSGDGLRGSEGAFLACSFWLADAWVLQGRHAEAVKLFERLAGLCNDVGLLSEEYDTGKDRMLGNFPQAFSHVALVNTAYNLSRGATPAEQRANRSEDGST